MNAADRKRFFSLVDRSSGKLACHPWLGGQRHHGYGAFAIDGRRYYAHRVAFFIARGRWPEPFCCHTCDNPSCVNKRHLFEGTIHDNTADMRAKGRGVDPPVRLGEEHARARLDVAAVREIRSIGGSETQRELARRFGVCQRTIVLVLSGRTWRHVLP